jgi:UDP-N-acetylmuramate--alanine ligase
LLKAIKKPKDKFYIKDFDEIKQFLKKNLKRGDICIIMGAGDIWKLTKQLL